MEEEREEERAEEREEERAVEREEERVEERKKRMIHIRLPEDTHKRLRVRVAELDTTIQDWVSSLVQKVLKRVEGGKS